MSETTKLWYRGSYVERFTQEELGRLRDQYALQAAAEIAAGRPEVAREHQSGYEECVDRLKALDARQKDQEGTKQFLTLYDRLVAATGSPGLTGYHEGKVHMTLSEWERLIKFAEEAKLMRDERITRVFADPVVVSCERCGREAAIKADRTFEQFLYGRAETGTISVQRDVIWTWDCRKCGTRNDFFPEGI